MTVFGKLRFVGGATVATALVAQPSRAQSVTLPSIDVSVASYEAASVGHADPALLIAPSLRINRSWGTTVLRTEAEVGERTIRVHMLDAAASVVTARFGDMRAEVSGLVRHSGTLRNVPTSLAGVQARIHTSSPTRGAWAGLGAQRVWASGIGRATPIATIGGWMRLRGITLTGELTYSRLPEFGGTNGFPDTLALGASQVSSPEAAPVYPESTLGPRPANPRPPPRQGSSWQGGGTSSTEAQIGMHWGAGRIELSGLAAGWLGRTVGLRSWASAHATFWLTPHIAVIAGGGRRPLGAGTGGVSSRFAAFGVRLARWPLPRRAPRVAPHAAVTSFRVTRLGGQTTIEARAPGAARVELKGDLTQWSAVALRRAGMDRWVIELPLRPGIYHVSLRINGGAWTPPPGLPTMPDGYGGLTGILVVS